jgi:uncharacterized protein YkwD
VKKRYFILPIAILVAVFSLGAINHYSKAETPQIAPEVVTEVKEEPKQPEYRPSTEAINNEVNKQRTMAGLTPLTPHDNLYKSATDKCNDIITKKYWAHDSPEGSEPWVFIEKYVGSYTKLGENLANGYQSDESLVAGWMDSPTHRDNIMYPSYKYVGYSVCHGKDIGNQKESWIVVQHFYQ